MSSNFGSLEIAKKALLANRFGIDVTSNNIANVNTEGYSRRQASFSETGPMYTSSGFIGTGVVANNLRTFREEYIDKEVRSSISRQSAYEADQTMYRQVEAILAEPSDSGLNELTANLFTAFEELSNEPESTSLRSNVLTVAETLTERFHTIAENLQSMRREVSNSVVANVGEANTIISQIAGLNSEIASSKAMADGTESQTLVDQREKLIEDLGNIVGVYISNADNGQVNVYVNGNCVVTGSTASTLQANETVDSATGERTMQIVKLDSKGNPLSVIVPDSGELSSQLKHYNTTLDWNDSSGGFSIYTELNSFANAIVEKVNEITVEGYGLDDTGTTSPGRTFFEPSTGGANAFTIEVSDDVKDRPRDIPISDTAGEPGNNTLALRLSRLATDTDFINSETASEYYTTFLGRVGTLSSEAASGLETASLVTDQLVEERESAIGVNLDEEAVNLIKFQRAFEASSRVINTTNEMLQVIVNLGQ